MLKIRRVNIGISLLIAGTFLTSIAVIGTLDKTSVQTFRFASKPTGVESWDEIDDVTVRLRRHHERVLELRRKLEHLTLKTNRTNDESENFQNVGLKRHLMDTRFVDQNMMPLEDEHKTNTEENKTDLTKGIASSFKLRIPKMSLFNVMFECKDIEASINLGYVGTGYTKTVELVSVNGTRMALKRPSMGGKDMSHCVGSGTPRADCWTFSSYKVLKELALLQQLRHPGIIKLLGFCIKEGASPLGRFSDVMLLTELGEPLDFLRLVQTPWEDRLQIIQDLTQLLVYLANSPLGPLTIHDFKPTQFVLVDGRVKLADLDDVDSNVPACSSTNHCTIPLQSGDRYLPCDSMGRCHEYADKINVALAWQHFFSLQMYGGPTWLQKEINIFLNKTKSADVSSQDALRLVENIVTSYKIGNYTIGHVPKYSYNVTYDVDLIGKFDYWCTYTRNPEANTCVFSVASEEEAKHMCSLDNNCYAFVLTEEITWTGRRLVYFKSGFQTPVRKHGSKLFVRIS